MNKMIKGFTYSFYRNIGWQDRSIRALVGVVATISAIYFWNKNTSYSIMLGILAIAQFGTILSSRCIICYFAGQCTIGNEEKSNLSEKGIPYEK